MIALPSPYPTTYRQVVQQAHEKFSETVRLAMLSLVLTPAQLTELVQRTEQLGYTALWYPEVLGYESFALDSFLLRQTTRLVIASGIANMYARDATAAKQGQHTLAELSGGLAPADDSPFKSV